jgi:hypothetical protein
VEALVVRIEPHIEGLSYCHPRDYYRGRDAGSAIRYLVRRPASKADPAAGGWRSVSEELRLGDAKRFKEAADLRTRELWEDARRRGKRLSKNKAPWCVSYLHLVLSPRNREELSVDDFKEIAKPWVVDGNGEEVPHFGAIHTDGRHGPHAHVLVVRDKLKPRELGRLKARTRTLATLVERDRVPRRERTREREIEREW